MVTVLEVDHSGICESEGKEWIEVRHESEIPEHRHFTDPEFARQMANVFANTDLDTPVTFTMKRVSDEDWNKACALGASMA